jgi:hypothetical protein
VCCRPAQITTTGYPDACGRAKGEHEAAIDLRAVPGSGAEIALIVDGEMQRTRLCRAHEQAELSGAIADTRAMFAGKGWP